MKAILTLVFIIFIGTFATAQSKETKVKTVTQGVTLTVKLEKKDVKKVEVARLYLYKNSRIKKELRFATKNNKAKMA